MLSLSWGCHDTYRHIQDHDSGDEAHAETRNETANDHNCQARRGSFEDASNAKDEATTDDGHPASNEIGQVSCHNCAEESASREDGSGQRLVTSRKMESLNGWVRGIS